MSFVYLRFSHLFKAFVLTACLFSCSEVIDLKVDGSEALLVVDGRITDGLAGNEVHLAMTSSRNGAQETVSGARITLLENGEEIANYLEYEPGLIDWSTRTILPEKVAVMSC